MKSKINIFIANILQNIVYFNNKHRNLITHRSAKNQNRSKLIDLPTIYSGGLEIWRIGDNYER